jgi:hypothetical protein
MDPADNLPNQPANFVDQDGYEHRTAAEARHPEKGWRAWVEEKSKWVEKILPGESKPQRWLDNEFRLRAMIDNRLAIDWVVETYNPAFGCEVGYLAWHGEHVVAVYLEKHDTYVCALAAGAPVKLLCISHEWSVAGGVLSFLDYGSGRVKRLSLPSLEPLPS